MSDFILRDFLVTLSHCVKQEGGVERSMLCMYSNIYVVDTVTPEVAAAGGFGKAAGEIDLRSSLQHFAGEIRFWK